MLTKTIPSSLFLGIMSKVYVMNILQCSRFFFLIVELDIGKQSIHNVQAYGR